MRANPRKPICLCVPLVLPLLLGYAHGGVTLNEVKVNGKTAYRLANERVVLVIDPARGGAVTSYKDKRGGDVELVHDYGLCLDHFQAQPWPGELLGAVYQAKIIERSANKCAIQLSYRTKGSWRDVAYPKLKGLLLEKTYVLCAGRAALDCRVKITAPKTE